MVQAAVRSAHKTKRERMIGRIAKLLLIYTYEYKNSGVRLCRQAAYQVPLVINRCSIYTHSVDQDLICTYIRVASSMSCVTYRSYGLRTDRTDTKTTTSCLDYSSCSCYCVPVYLMAWYQASLTRRTSAYRNRVTILVATCTEPGSVAAG